MNSNYDARIARARFLKSTYPFAAEMLTFYERICAVQAQIKESLQATLRGQAVSPNEKLRDRLSVDLLLPLAPRHLPEIARASPAPLKEFISEYLKGSTERRAASLQRYVDSAGCNEFVSNQREELLARILVDPYAELLASQMAVVSTGVSGNLCPRCGARPFVGVLRIEGDGGKRFLKCSFCADEWEFRRIYCAYCGEAREQSLPVFVAEKFPHIRVEGCDTCRHCIRTVDLTKDGNAIPAPDDLAAIPLGLWADRHEYQRIHGNLLGT